MTDELHNANADVKRFREAASCERDVRVELEKQVSTLQAEVRRLHHANQEPVAWLIEYENGEREVRFVAGTRGIKQTPLYTAPQPADTALLRQALEALDKLWQIIDDIDTYGDMAKADDKLYRSLVERKQRTRFEETGISTDGYTLNGGAITALRAAIKERLE